MAVPYGRPSGEARVETNIKTDARTEGTDFPTYFRHQFDEIPDNIYGFLLNKYQNTTVFSFLFRNNLTVRAVCFTNIFCSTLFE